MASSDTYNDSHRAFLQAFLSRSVMTFDDAKPLLAAILAVHEEREVLANDITLEDFHSYISATNTAISPLDLEIRSTFHQQSRERIYALVNMSSDAFTQLATTYTAEEIAFVNRVLDAMFDGANNKGRREGMCVSGIDAIQLARTSGKRDTQTGNSNGASQASAGQGLSMRDAEAMMGRLVDEGWFEKSRKGFYSLSPRSLMELRIWLVEAYNEDPVDEGGDAVSQKIKFCHACKEIITVGQRCKRRECLCRLHDICTQNFFVVQRSRVCPLCKSEWDGKHYVGEKAITSTDAYLKSKRQSGGTRPAAASPPNDHGNAEDDE